MEFSAEGCGHPAPTSQRQIHPKHFTIPTEIGNVSTHGRHPLRGSFLQQVRLFVFNVIQTYIRMISLSQKVWKIKLLG